MSGSTARILADLLRAACVFSFECRCRCGELATAHDRLRPLSPPSAVR